MEFDRDYLTGLNSIWDLASISDDIKRSAFRAWIEKDFASYYYLLGVTSRRVGREISLRGHVLEPALLQGIEDEQEREA